MNFVLVDDVREHHEILSSKLGWACKELGIPCNIVLTTEEAKQAIDYAPNAEDGTVWFLDIELTGEVNGIDICRMIHEQNARSYIVYVSAYQQYALECLQSHAFDFLLKPWTEHQLLDCLGAILREQERLKNGNLLIAELGTRQIRLRQENILYFSKDRMSITAHYANGRTFTWRESLESVHQRVRKDWFFQCHKSYLINMTYLQEVRWAEDTIQMEDGQCLPLSRRRAEDLHAVVNRTANSL